MVFCFGFGGGLDEIFVLVHTIMMGRSNTFTTNIDFYMGHYFIMNNARDNATFITSSGGSINFFSWCSLRNLIFLKIIIKIKLNFFYKKINKNKT